MYFSNEGIKTNPDINFDILIKADKYGIEDWQLTLLNKNKIEVLEINYTVNEYFIYDISDKLDEDTSEGAYEIIVKDASLFNINNVIKIKGFVASVIDINVDDNKLYLSKPIDKIYLKEENIYVLKYPQLTGMYKFTTQINRVGNFVLNIVSYDGIINKYINIDTILKFDTLITTKTDNITLY